ncbi:MAG TPA: YggT family protein [Bacillota bacterium]|nr:YggT family protein [Bacillota bacterium]HOJ84596.1 YggT family protein [Bacillota bacterium]HOL15411.1 YggT family protein [Bacillota bacterium]HPZ11632.1 YggT family protein [Bacillota bacterium]HQE09485.1 YggT family protein [Bacillota bacterium]
MYLYIILGRIILSWFQGQFYRYPILRQIFSFCFVLTEPLMAPLRRIVPPVRLGMGYMDLSALILWMLLLVVRQLVGRLFF